MLKDLKEVMENIISRPINEEKEHLTSKVYDLLAQLGALQPELKRITERIKDVTEEIQFLLLGELTIEMILMQMSDGKQTALGIEVEEYLSKELTPEEILREADRIQKKYNLTSQQYNDYVQSIL